MKRALVRTVITIRKTERTSTIVYTVFKKISLLMREIHRDTFDGHLERFRQVLTRGTSLTLHTQTIVVGSSKLSVSIHMYSETVAIKCTTSTMFLLLF